jgi:hypothetical protein
MTEAAPRKPSVRQNEWMLVAGIVLALGALFVWSRLPAPEPPGLLQCDQAIMATLKAPATYKRVSALGSDTPWIIEYDAENSFGVPLRGKGICRVSSDGAEWTDMTDLMR